MTSCLVYKLGELARSQGLLLGNGLGIGLLVVSNCTVCHSLCIFFY